MATTGRRYPPGTTVDSLQEAAIRRDAGQTADGRTLLGGARATRTVRSGKGPLAVGPSTGGRGSSGRLV